MEIKFDNYKKALLLATLNYKLGRVYDYKEYMKWRKDAAMASAKNRAKKKKEKEKTPRCMKPAFHEQEKQE